MSSSNPSEENQQIPATLGEAAEREKHSVVSAGRENFNTLYHQALEADEHLRDNERRLQALVHEGIECLRQAGQLLIHMKKLSPELVHGEVRTVREERDESLLREDYSAIRLFYEEIAKLLMERGKSGEEGITVYQFHERAKQILACTHEGGYVLKYFEKDIDEALELPFEESRHESLKARVLSHLAKDDSTSTDEKLFIRSKLRNTFDVLRVLSGKSREGQSLMLSDRSVHGMLGRVLSEQEMNEVFAGNMNSIKTLPSASVEVTFADRTESFYHRGSQEKVPPEILRHVSGESDGIPSHILLVHYRTDDDVRALMEDMSDGQELRGTHRATNAPIVIVGKSDSPDVDIQMNIPGVKNEDIQMRPMEHLNHKLNFHESD